MESSVETPMKADLFGVVAFMILARLMALLETKGVLTNEERAKLFNDATNLSPPADPRVQDMKQLLRALVASTLPGKAADGTV